MKPEKVFGFFGGVQETADALGLTFQSVNAWKDRGRVPELRQFQLYAASSGRLVPDQPVALVIQTIQQIKKRKAPSVA